MKDFCLPRGGREIPWDLPGEGQPHPPAGAAWRVPGCTKGTWRWAAVEGTVLS